MSVRRITSMIMLVSFILLVLTSIILYIVPHGRVAYWADWHLWGLTKTQWDNLHINLGCLFLLAGVLHIYFNWTPLLEYMKNKSKKIRIFTFSFNIALVLSLLVAAGTLLDVPPMSSVISLSNTIKEKEAEKYGEPPYGHAELSSLKLFARRVNLDLDKATELLKKSGIRFEGTGQTIKKIAQTNNISPKQLFEIMRPAIIKTQAGASFPDTPPPGFGHKELTDICREYGLQLPTIQTRASA